MSLDAIVNLTITTNTSAPSRAGFGTALLIAYHTIGVDRYKLYSSLTELVDAGFSIYHPVYRMATALFSQNPKPPSFAVGKRLLAPVQVIELIPVNLVAGYVYAFKMIRPNGASVTITFTNDAVPTMAEATAALTTAINASAAAAEVTAVDTAGVKVVVTTDTPGAGFALVDYTELPGPAFLKIKDLTADPGLATDLAEIEVANANDWYLAGLDSNSEAEINALATFIEARRKIAVVTSTDWTVADAGQTTDVFSDNALAANERTGGLYIQNRLLSYAAIGWAGSRLPRDPGSDTWSFKTIAGVTVDTLQGGQLAAIEAKNGNHYTRIGGLNITRYGKTFSGEYFDTVRFIDWLYARMQEKVYGILYGAEKVPFTDSGVDCIRNGVISILDAGIKAGGLAADPAPTVTAPKVADVDIADKALRHLPDITFQAILAGAIHKVTIQGVISL